MVSDAIPTSQQQLGIGSEDAFIGQNQSGQRVSPTPSPLPQPPLPFSFSQIEGRDLPVMDRNLQGEAFTDSYVDIWIGKHENHRTHTIRKTLNPVWDEEFRFEIVDDSLLQNTPVEFKVTRERWERSIHYSL